MLVDDVTKVLQRKEEKGKRSLVKNSVGRKEIREERGTEKEE